MDVSFPFLMFLALVGACVFCWYLSPDRVESPSKFQRTVAILWIIFRRLVSFSCAVLIMLFIYILWDCEATYLNKVFGSLGLFVMFLYTIYIGIVGQGWNQYGIRDDIELYKKIKKKYGLKW